jgi:NADH-quinone oxidoreductase subunit I
MAKNQPGLLADVLNGAWSLVVGLRVTLKNWMEPKITVQYPFKEKLSYAPRYRGRMVHLRDPETGRLRCTACQACVKACPANVIALEGDDKKGRERRARSYVWNQPRCMFCNLCVEACPFKAIILSNETDSPAYSREDLVWQLDRMLEPWHGSQESDSTAE